MNDQYHYLQREILNNLLFTDQLPFSKLKPKNIEGSLFTFHLNKLIEDGLIEKNKDGQYSLSDKGKNIANTHDKESNQPNKQAKHSAVFCATKNNQSEFLLYTRLKNPFFGCQGFPTGKVKYGESILDTAKRELFEETNLIGQPQLKAIRHFRVYDKATNIILEDKVMYICEVKDPSGELKSNLEGDFKWVAKDKINSFVTNPLEEFQEIFEILCSEYPVEFFKEVNHYTNKF